MNRTGQTMGIPTVLGVAVGLLVLVSVGSIAADALPQLSTNDTRKNIDKSKDLVDDVVPTACEKDGGFCTTSAKCREADGSSVDVSCDGSAGDVCCQTDSGSGDSSCEAQGYQCAAVTVGGDACPDGTTASSTPACTNDYEICCIPDSETCADPRFGWDPYFVSDGMQTEFSASPGSCDSYTWDFGDGNTGTGAAVSHAYGSPGTYTVTLETTGSAGTNTVQHSITVKDNLEPGVSDVSASEANPSADGDDTSSPGEPVTLTATASDPDGSIASYAWTGDGYDLSACSGESCTHTFSSDGFKTGTVTVTDNDGGEGSLEFGIYIGYTCEYSCIDSQYADSFGCTQVEGTCPGESDICCK